MRQSDFRRVLEGSTLVATFALAGAVLPSTASAQAATDPAPVTRVDDDVDDVNDDDTEWGWVGLLGLAGLLGLRRRDHHTVHRVDHVDNTTTRRP